MTKASRRTFKVGSLVKHRRQFGNLERSNTPNENISLVGMPVRRSVHAGTGDLGNVHWAVRRVNFGWLLSKVLRKHPFIVTKRNLEGTRAMHCFGKHKHSARV